MDLDETFQDAATRVKSLSKRPGNDVLLDLYALYKQGSEGDVSGKRPGAFDLKGRAKHDAWARRRGMGQDEAKEAYVALVDRLLSAE